MPRRSVADPPVLAKSAAPASPMVPPASAPRCLACFGVGWQTTSGKSCTDCRGTGKPREARA